MLSNNEVNHEDMIIDPPHISNLCLLHACRLLGLLAALGIALPVAGAETIEEAASESSFSLRGFGTLGITRSSSDKAEFVRDLSQPTGISNHWSGLIDTIIGVQANWQAAPEVEFVAQAVSRYHYNRSRDPELMWGFVKWEPDARLSLRVGRIGADFMMLADSRLVGYSYLPARPPADFFGPLFFSHFDGADARLTLPLGDGLVRGKLFAGATQEKTSGAPGIWDTSGSPVHGLVLDYQTGRWQFRANAASIHFASDINFSQLSDPLRMIGTPATNAAADALATRGTTSRFYSLGAVYDHGPLQVQGMLNVVHHESGVFQNSRAGYLLAGYRLGSITPYTGISWWKSKYKPFSTGLPGGAGFDTLNNNFNIVMHASAADQKTYTLGARWDAWENIAIKAQWDAVRGTPESRFPYASTESGWNGHTNVLSLVLDFIF
jgi:hypothetical protein